MRACASCGSPLPDDARFCPSCGAPVEAPEVPSVDERKLATVLFADLVGSTALASDEDPERVRALQERFFAAMAEEIERTGGTVEKFAGDAVMAVFGVPAALEDHAERALHAALAMHRRLGEDFGDTLALRIGVNTGEVVVGTPREGSTFVTGDAVNVGARLEQAAEPGQVLAGERTVAAARGAFEFGDLRVVAGKGKPDGIECRPVLRALSLMRPRGVGGLNRVFVGRESELDLLRATFRRAVAQAEPHLVTIVGPPGVGKTRLVRELWEALGHEQPAPLRRTGRCLPYGDGITYWPLGEVVKEHFGILESDPPEEVRKRLAGHELLGLTLGLDVARGLHPLKARDRLHQTVVRFVEELAAERPLAKLVEDLHWAEDDLLDLLERVLREAHGPVVLLATARPELLDRRPTWGAVGRNATTIWLEPLRAEDTSQLVDDLLGLELPERLRALLVERSEGNPFFAEELLRELLDGGVLERVDETLRVHELTAGFSVPDSVQAVLAARVDRLPPVEKAALQAASVVGRIFWDGPVVYLLDGAEPDFGLLEERDFVRRRVGSSMAGEREYAFKHALTREVAYASLPKARRGRLHAAFAAWIERSDPARDEHASLLAYHYSEAVRSEDADLVWGGERDEYERLRRQAVVWLRRAGELARGRYEMEDAVELLTRAAELADEPVVRSELWREIGLCNALRYDGEAFWDAMHRSLELCTDRATCAEAYSQLAFQTSIRSGMWRVRPRRLQVEEWVERALELADDGSMAKAQALLARANIAPELVADDVLLEAARVAEELGDLALRSYAFAARSHAAFVRGNFEEAALWTERRLELVAELDDPDGLCEAYESAVPVAGAVGRFREARRLAGQHLALARRLSAHHRVHAVSLELELDESLGDWEGLVRGTDRVVRAVQDNLDTPCVRNARGLLVSALAHLCIGDVQTARELEARAEGLAGRGHEFALDPVRLRMALVRGDGAAARELLRTPIRRTFVWGASVFAVRLDALTALGDREAIEQEAPALARPRTYAEPFALRALGAARREDALLERAQKRFRALGLHWHAAETERLLDWPG
jgi:class 3 adenylate cyclase